MSSTARNDLPWPSRAVLLGGTGLLRALGSTWRFRIRGVENVDRLRAAGEPFIYSLWHGQLLPLLWHHRGQGVSVLISEHRDGEMVARVASSLGYRLIRGSTTRGGERALIAIVRELRSGGEIAITPDGPKGPPHSFAAGAIVAAHKAGAPILPVAAHVDRAWQLKSWDRFIIPKPFARVTIAYGSPSRVAASSSREAPAQAGVFERLMQETEQVACT